MNLAEISLKYRDFGNAAQQYEAIRKKAPKDRASRIGLAVAYKGLGRYDQAETILKGLVAEKSKDVDAVWNLAVLYHINETVDAVVPDEYLEKKLKEATENVSEKVSEIKKKVIKKYAPELSDTIEKSGAGSRSR